MTKFKVGDKVRVIDKFPGFRFDNGKIIEVTAVDSEGIYVTDGNCKGYGLNRRFVLAHEQPPKQTKSQRIAALEAEAQRQDERVTDLERKVAELERKLTSKPVYESLKASLEEAIEKAPESAEKVVVNIDVDVPKNGAEKAAEFLCTFGKSYAKSQLTPNEQRKAIIAEAKAFEEKWSRLSTTKITYEINAEKRTVVALRHRRDNGRVFQRGIAKAHPDDVFNADIGKAIALGRALGLDVTRFEKAVQPTEVVVGMITCAEISGNIYEVKAFHPDEKLDGKYGRAIAPDGIENIAWVGTKQVVIIDDTEAQY